MVTSCDYAQGKTSRQTSIISSTNQSRSSLLRTCPVGGLGMSPGEDQGGNAPCRVQGSAPILRFQRGFERACSLGFTVNYDNRTELTGYTSAPKFIVYSQPSLTTGPASSTDQLAAWRNLSASEVSTHMHSMHDVHAHGAEDRLKINGSCESQGPTFAKPLWPWSDRPDCLLQPWKLGAKHVWWSLLQTRKQAWATRGNAWPRKVDLFQGSYEDLEGQAF